MAQDRGLLLGDGLFETLLADKGRLVLFDEHAARLTRGCAVLGLPAPSQARLRRAAQAALTRAGLADQRAAVRLTWSAGAGGRGLERPPRLSPRLSASASAAPKSAAPATLALADIARNPTSPTSRLKTLAYLDNVLARRQALAAGADEALMLNTSGQVACAAAANVFWLTGAVLFTPALDCGVLDGIARARVMAGAPGLGLKVIETREGRDSLARADAIFLTNSLIGVRPVSRLDAQSYGPNAMAARLAGVCGEIG
jgi:branched-chain amino acid aminotransferase/4-amino-4-deoxychorismate lyase